MWTGADPPNLLPWHHLKRQLPTHSIVKFHDEQAIDVSGVKQA